MDKTLNASTILLYSDKRVNLKDIAYKKTKEIFKLKNIDYVVEDIKYYENIKIDDCREIISLSTKSSYKGLKIFILNLDNIRDEASNSLLKMIEEPVDNTYFILTSNNKNKVLPTILSRCLKEYIAPENINIDIDLYNIFDGNINYIEKFLEEKINISDYEIKEIDDAINALENYYNNSENMYIFLKYRLAIKYLSFNLKFNDNKKDKIIAIYQIQDLVSKDRQKAIELLNAILILCPFKVNKETYKILVDLKNSIRNNVNVRIVIYLFLSIIFEEV